MNNLNEQIVEYVIEEIDAEQLKKLKLKEYKQKLVAQYREVPIDYEGVKKCSCCQFAYLKTHFRQDRCSKSGFHSLCKYCGCKSNYNSKKKHHQNVKDKSMLLTRAQYHILLDLNCVWCGGKGGSVDRWDSNENYHINNVVPCCYECNYKKSDDSPAEFIDYIRRFAPSYEPFVQYDEHYKLVKPPLLNLKYPNPYIHIEDV